MESVESVAFFLFTQFALKAAAGNGVPLPIAPAPLPGGSSRLKGGIIGDDGCSPGVVGSGTHSWRNQSKNATDYTDFTDLAKKTQSCAGAGRSSSNVSSAGPLGSVESVESVAFFLFTQFALKAAAGNGVPLPIAPAPLPGGSSRLKGGIIGDDGCSPGVVGSGTHSWRNQSKNATDYTDFTDLAKKTQSCAGAGRSSSNVSSAGPLESVESVESVAFFLFTQFALKAAAGNGVPLPIAPAPLPGGSSRLKGGIIGSDDRTHG